MPYDELINLPTINGVTVVGDKSLEDYGLIPMTEEDILEIEAEVFGSLV